MRNRLVCIGVLCVLCAVQSTATWAQNQPTSGDGPAFATEADVKLSTIRSLIGAKDYDNAESLAEEITRESPGMLDAWMMLAYTRTLTGKFALSNDAYDVALEYGADKKEIYIRKAYNCRRLGDVDQTRECYRLILEDDASNVEVLVQFGAYEQKTENYDAAAELFMAALDIQPEHMQAIEALAKTEEKRGNNAQVKYWLERGISYEPENTKLLKRLSLVYLNEQNYSLAIHYLDKVIAIDPENTAAHRNKGIAHYQQGNKKKAIESFEAVRTLGGKTKGLYGPLADCYRSAKKSSKALEIVKEGLSEDDQKAWLYSVWGKILEDQKNYDAAIAKFSHAVALKDEPWSGYARKQISRQSQLKKREAMIAAQAGME